MKLLLLTGMVTVCLLACNVSDKGNAADGAPKNEGAAALKEGAKSTTLEWLDPVEQNLGELKQGQVAEISWKFKNTGSSPLYITNVHAQCGCTTPEPPREPIAPGEVGTIKATFNSSNFSGHVTKEVYVEANNSNRNHDVDNLLVFTADIK